MSYERRTDVSRPHLRCRNVSNDVKLWFDGRVEGDRLVVALLTGAKLKVLRAFHAVVDMARRLPTLDLL